MIHAQRLFSAARNTENRTWPMPRSEFSQLPRNRLQKKKDTTNAKKWILQLPRDPMHAKNEPCRATQQPTGHPVTLEDKKISQVFHRWQHSYSVWKQTTSCIFIQSITIYDITCWTCQFSYLRDIKFSLGLLFAEGDIQLLPEIHTCREI